MLRAIPFLTRSRDTQASQAAIVSATRHQASSAAAPAVAPNAKTEM